VRIQNKGWGRVDSAGVGKGNGGRQADSDGHDHQAGSVGTGFGLTIRPIPCRRLHCKGTLNLLSAASISGMYVEVVSELFAEYGVIEVEVTLPGVAALRTWRWRAMVVRRTRSSIGRAKRRMTRKSRPL